MWAKVKIWIAGVVSVVLVVIGFLMGRRKPADHHNPVDNVGGNPPASGQSGRADSALERANRDAETAARSQSDGVGKSIESLEGRGRELEREVSSLRDLLERTEREARKDNKTTGNIDDNKFDDPRD